MSITPHSGIIDFGTFTSPTGGLDGIQGEVPAPLIAEAGYILSTNGWIPNPGSTSGTVTSVAMTVPTGLSISGSPITTSGTLAVTYAAGYAIPTTASQTNWDTAYTDRLKWDGGATGLVAATGRTSLGLGTSAVLNAGVAGGVATLDGGGTVPTSQLPAAVLGAVKYQGTWNASTNTPTLTSSTGTQGYYYVVSVAGSTNLDGITDWNIGDWAIYNGTAWQKIDNTDAVTSVNGFTGAVSLTTSNVAEGTSLYFTDARARLALSAGTGISYNNLTGVITNSAPDQVVSLTGAGTTAVTGTYPSFTITSNDAFTGTVTSVSGSGGTTGLTLTGGPITGSGTLTLGGTLAVANGGTGTTTAFTTGSVLFAGASGVYSQDNANLFWDDTNNRLGVGTAAPGAPLDVNGAIYSRTGGVYTDAISAYGGSSISINAGSSNLNVVVNGSERMRIDASGRVGIGVTPSASTEPLLQMPNGGMIAMAGPYAHLIANAYYNVGWKYTTTATASRYEMDGSHKWFTAASGTAGTAISFTQAMTLDSGGNLSLSTLGLSSNSPFYTGGNISSGANALGIGSTGAAQVGIFTNNSERVRVTSAGDVGIGTSSPGAKLQVGDAGSTAPVKILIRSASADTYLQSTSTGSVVGTPNGVPLMFNTNDAERMRIDSAGNVGIGTSSLSNKFTVQVTDATAWTPNTTSAIQVLFNDGAANNATALTLYQVVYGDSTTGGVKVGAVASGSYSADFVVANRNGGTFQEKFRIASTGAIGLSGANYGSSGQVLTSQGSGSAPIWSTPSGSGDVLGPASATDNAIARFDGTTGKLIQNSGVVIDDSGNVGIGTVPSAWSSLWGVAQIYGSAFGNDFGNSASAHIMNNAYADSANTLRYIGSSYATKYTQGYFDGAHKWYTAASGTAGTAISFTQAMTLDASGNLALGRTSASYRLDMTGSARVDGYVINVSGGTIYNLLANDGGNSFVNAVGAGNFGVGTSSPSAKLSVADAAAAKLNLMIGAGERAYIDYTEATSLMRIDSDGALALNTNNTERMRIDSSGNVGIGVTPSAWSGYNKTLQGQGWAITAPGNDSMQLLSNAYYNGGWKYIGPYAAAQYSQLNGVHSWTTAASGTAGTAISFTQAMTLDASGRLLIGQTANPNGYYLIANTGSASNNNAAYFTNDTDADFAVKLTSGVSLLTPSTGTLALGTSNTERLRIDSSGNVGIGTSSPSASAKLHVEGTVQITATRLYASSPSAGNYDLRFQTYSGGFFDRMTIDYAGNVGIGVTPSAWGTTGSARALEFNAGSILSYSTNELDIQQNAYWNGTSWIYKSTAVATQYQQVTGQHRWYNAVSGTAGAAISFTQAMTLDASGNLMVGVTSATRAFRALRSGAAEISLCGGANAESAELYLAQANATDAYVWNRANGPLLFGTNNTDRMRIDSAGNVSVGTTSAASGVGLNVYAEKAIFGNGGGATGPRAGFYSSSTFSGMALDDSVASSGSGFLVGADYFYIERSVASGNTQITNTSATGAMIFGAGVAGAEKARIHASGGVSIGNTTDPGAGNATAVGFQSGYTTTATAAGTTTLTVTSNQMQYFTGTSTQTVVLPVTSTLQLGWSYHIANTSTGVVTLQSSGANTICLIQPGATVMVTCILTSGTTAASWDYGYTDFNVDTRLVEQNAQTGSYGLTSTDIGKHIYHDAGAAAATYTIPANGTTPLPIGTAFTFANMSTNNVTIAITTDTMYLAGTGTTGSRTLAQYGVATALKLTATTWIISGSGLT